MGMNSSSNSGKYAKQEVAILGLETYLKQTMEPVKPRQEFAHFMRGRLEHPPVHQTFAQGSYQTLILIVAGFLGVMLLVVTAVRAVTSLIEAMRILRNRKAQSEISAVRSHSVTLIKSASTGS